MKLRPYQQPIYDSVVHAVARRAGDILAVTMSRQSGKNETSSKIERDLLVGMAAERVTAVKAAPTEDQAAISRRRLVHQLRGIPHRNADGQVSVGHAAVRFLTARPHANIVGHTADLLLEADEAQDIDPDKWNKDLRPMAASTAAPSVVWGTPWTEDDVLWTSLDAARTAERRSGFRQAFVVPWPDVAAVVPAYGTYVESERARLGANHPLFITQYDCQPLPGQGRLLTAAQLAALNGTHPRLDEPLHTRRAAYVAGLDVAGESEQPHPRGHDRTVLTIAHVEWSTDTTAPPVTRACTAYEWQGEPHADLYPLIAQLARAWRLRRIAVDTTGLGEALGLYLEREIGPDKVIKYRFTQLSKSNLGFGLQAAATTGRFSYWQDDGSPERRRALGELRLCRADYQPNRSMRWYVREEDGHDDHVASAALCVHAAEQSPRPRVARMS